MEQAKNPSPLVKKPLSDKVTWNPVIGVGYVIAVFFSSQLFAVLIVQLLYAVAGAKTVSLTDSTTAQFLFTLFAEAISITAVIYFVKGYRVNLAAIGLKRPRWSDLLYGLGMVPIYFVLLALVVVITKALIPELNIDQKQEIGFENVVGTVPLILTFISLAILPPLAEEIMVRGLLYSSLRKAMRFIPAAIISSFIFAIAHLQAGGESGLLYIAAIDTFVLGMLLVYLREKTGSLWPAILLHAIKNGIAFTALFVFI